MVETTRGGTTECVHYGSIAVVDPAGRLIASVGDPDSLNFTRSALKPITAESADELARMIKLLWKLDLDYLMLGGGSNVLVSDRGVRGVVVLNRAKVVHFHTGDEPFVRAESGVVFSNLANRCAYKGLSGLEWAATVPGTIGGAVSGNAGAFGGDMAGNLIRAELLTESGREKFTAEQMGYGYRTSMLKRGELDAVVLAAELRLTHSTREEVDREDRAV